MRRTLSKGLPVGMILLMLAVLMGPLGDSPLSAQPGSKKKGKAAMDKEEKDGPRVQLPAHFKDVVDEKQKEQIYAIQKKYADKTADLTKQLTDLKSQRDKEIDGVLTADQLKKIDALKAGSNEKSKVKKAVGKATKAKTETETKPEEKPETKTKKKS